MPHEFINPNYHVILIHAPLGLLTIGTLIELFGFLWPKSAFRDSGRWMILLGALTAAPTATSGLYAMWDVNQVGVNDNTRQWSDIRADSPVQGAAWEMLKDHAWLNGGATVAILLMVVVWMGCSDAWRRRMHLAFLAVLLGSMITMVFGAWNAGEMVYRKGVAVGDDKHSYEPLREPDVKGVTADQEFAAIRKQPTFYLPPMQLHVILAGTAIAFAMASLGLALRGTTKTQVDAPPPLEVGAIAGAFETRPVAFGMRRTEGYDPPEKRDEYIRVPTARFWLLTFLFAATTAIAGGWVMGHFAGRGPNELWDIIKDRANDDPPITRRMAHFVVGVSIVVLPLILALIARFAPRRRILLGVFSLLLIVMASAQVWIGSLLMLDGPVGTIRAFNGSSDEGSTTRPTTAD